MKYIGIALLLILVTVVSSCTCDTGEKTTPFNPPTANISQWDTSLALTLRSPQAQARVYEVQDERFDRTLEYDITLETAPANNFIEFRIDSTGLNFYKQPSLDKEHTAQEIASWYKNGVHRPNEFTLTSTLITGPDGEIVYHRPEWCVNSYAVYSDYNGDYTALGGENYRAGKVCHIPREKVVDSSGWEVWIEDIQYDEATSTLRYILPKDFVRNADYPIHKAAGATIGYTTLGSSSGPVHGYVWLLQDDSLNTASNEGEVDTFHMGMEYYDNAPADVDYQIALYHRDDANSEWDRDGYSVIGSFPTGSATDPGWLTENVHLFFDPLSVNTSDTYGLMATYDYNEGHTPQACYDTGDSGDGARDWNTGGPGSVFGSTYAYANFSDNSNRYSLYVTYTPSVSSNIAQVHPVQWDSINQVHPVLSDNIEQIHPVVK